MNRIVLTVYEGVSAGALVANIATNPSEERSWMVLVFEQITLLEQVLVDF